LSIAQTDQIKHPIDFYCAAAASQRTPGRQILSTRDCGQLQAFAHGMFKEQLGKLERPCHALSDDFSR
ncbi:hypothetical protein, partial [Pseudomonas aeruginosa]|uniref:hypothetical protein n=1 Tax=Pseudomonas aeruginosa TaxID=287 RepID=UPI003CC5B386